MKKVKYIFVVMMLVAVAFLTMQVVAHNPQDMQLEHDFDNQELSVTITHVVLNPNNHYIYKVEIIKNDVPYLEELYTSQPTLDVFTYTYPVEADIGDKLKVIAYCSLFGSITKTITVLGDNQPPSAPIIDGPLSGNTGTEYEYTFVSTDLDGEDVKYFIDWGDGNDEETIFYASGEMITVKHTFTKLGTLTITAYAQDINGIDGPEGTLKITMPRNKAFNFNFDLLGWLFDRLPNAFPILRQIFGL